MTEKETGPGEGLSQPVVVSRGEAYLPAEFATQHAELLARLFPDTDIHPLPMSEEDWEDTES